MRQSGELGDLLGRYVFSANFDGDAREEFDAIMEWVNSQILAERKRCAEVAMKEARDFVEHRMVEVSYGATCAAKAIMAQ